VAEHLVHGRRLERQQPGAGRPPVGLLERGQVALTGVGGGGGERQREVHLRLVALRRLQCLPLDGVARPAEAVDHRRDELRELDGDRRAGRRRGLVGGGRLEGELPDEVVDVGLGVEQQVGRHGTELHRVERLDLVVVGVEQRLQLGERRDVQPVGGALRELGPDDLAAPVVLVDTPRAGQRRHERQAAAGHGHTAAAGRDRQLRPSVGHLEAHPRGHLAQAQSHGRSAVQQGVRHQLGDDEGRVVGDGVEVAAHHLPGEGARARDLLEPAREDELGDVPADVAAHVHPLLRPGAVARRRLRPIILPVAPRPPPGRAVP
jgi:hypothetical protein